MPSSAQVTYSGAELLNRDPKYSWEQAVQQIVSTSYAAGTPLGELTGYNEFVAIVMTGVPTGGTFTMTFGGQTTAATAYNATADLIRQRLEALSTIGPGNVKCTGGPLPNFPVIVEFQNALGNTNVGAITFTDSLTGGSTPATAATVLLTGAAASQVNGTNSFRQVDKTLVAAPTAGPTLTPATSGGVLTAGTLRVAYSFANPSGETPLSPVTAATIDGTDSDDKCAVTAVTPPSGCWVNWYASDLINSDRLVLVQSNSGATFDITRLNVNGITPPDQRATRAFASYDGRHRFRRLLKRQTSTDSAGNHTFGDVSTGHEYGTTHLAAPAFAAGMFLVSELVSFTADMLADVGGRVISGAFNAPTTCIVKF